MTVDLSIIIVTYNSEPQIGRLLDSIQKSKDKLYKEVIIIDNASQDKSREVIKKHPLKTIFIASSNNVGFSKSVNQGIKKSLGKYILLLNPDTVLKTNTLQKLFEFAEATPQLGAVAPALLDPDGKPQASVFKFPNIFNAILRYFFNQKEAYGKYLPTASPAGSLPAAVDVAIMAAFLIPKVVLEKVGLLDERYFMYYEDIEFCRQLKKNQLSVYYLPSAKVNHVHGASGKFTSHAASPLLKSAQTYHGKLYSDLLNLVLNLGQKYQKLLSHLHR